jgi:hypothetical protein
MYLTSYRKLQYFDMDQIDIINYYLFSLIEVNFVVILINLFGLDIRIMFHYLQNLLFLVCNGI